MANRRRLWTDLAEQRTFSFYPEFAELERFIDAFFNTPSGQFMSSMRECIDGLRYHLLPVLRSGYFDSAEIAANLGVTPATAYRFTSATSTPTLETFLTMMKTLAAEYEIEDNRNTPLRIPRLPAKPEPDLFFPTTELKVRAETQEALDALLETLEGMIPSSQRSHVGNKTPIDISPADYALLIATVRSAIAFSEVETWDKKTIRVIRALNDILLELENLLQTATSLASKQLLRMLRAVAKGLKTIADAIGGPPQ